MNLLQMDSNFPCFLCVQAKEIDRLVRKICMDPSTAQNQAMAAYSSEDPLLEKRMIKPQPEQALKCPRCDSTNTKFCYYNNYSLSQPRYFCKSCRRYWTKGGTLRNVPVGGGCRKKKRIISKKPQGHPLVNPTPNLSSLTYENSNDLTLAFTRIQKQPLKQLGSDEHDTTIFGTTTGILGNPNSNLCFLDKIRSGFGLGGSQDSNQYTRPINFNNFSTFSHENVEGGVEGYCKTRDEENRIWGLGGSIVDAARDYWSGAGSWHGLVNSFGPSSVSSLM